MVTVCAFGFTFLTLYFIWMVVTIIQNSYQDTEPNPDPWIHQMAIHLLLSGGFFIFISTVPFVMIFLPMATEIQCTHLKWWILTGVLCCFTSVAMVVLAGQICRLMEWKHPLLGLLVFGGAPMLSAWFGKKYLLWIQKRQQPGEA